MMNRLSTLEKERPLINEPAKHHLDWKYIEGIVARIGLGVIVAEVKAPLDYELCDWGSFGEALGQKLAAADIGGFDSADFLHWANPAAAVRFYWYCQSSQLAKALQLLLQEIATRKISNEVKIGHADPEARVWRTVTQQAPRT